ncbi:hypothetical protein ABT160_02750 [Streptomyces sp. NPDC001941]|uniref:hypothetical protein n=1 Tax=Streptomyces sp. NPDC001941 TaxID=3154659 RepID=UPI00331CFF81
MDMGALVASGVAGLVGVLTWQQSRASNRRSDFTAITERLDRELKEEKVQRRLTNSYVLELLRWARRVEPTTQAGPVPDPPADLDLSPWQP